MMERLSPARLRKAPIAWPGDASSPTSPKTTPPPRSTSSSTGPPNSKRS